MTRSVGHTRDMVWAMRSLRLILGDAAFRRRSAALRVEPSFGVSKLRSAAAIAIFWTLVLGAAVMV